MFNILAFLQESKNLPSELKVYVTIIAASHIMLNGHSVGKHPAITSFPWGMRWLKPDEVSDLKDGTAASFSLLETLACNVTLLSLSVLQ